MKRIRLTALFITVLPLGLFSGGTFYWNMDSYLAFNKGKLSGIKLNEEGNLSLSMKFKKAAGLESVFIWDMKEDSAGNVYLATGNEGVIYRMDKNGKVARFFQTGSVAGFRMLIDKEDNLYVATLTKGMIYRISPGGKSEILYTFPEESIWDMKWRRDRILIATGPPGVLYEFDIQSKKLKELALTKEMYITCVETDGSGNIFLATSERGAVYRLTAQGELKVIYQTGQSEIHSLVFSGGLIYAGTSDKESKFVKPDKQEKPDQQQKAQPSGNQNKNMYSESGPQVKKLGPVINAVYEIRDSEYVNRIMESQDSTFLSLMADGKDIYIGSGDNGVLYRYRGRKIEKIAQVEEQQILCLLRRRNGNILLGTGNIGNVYSADTAHAGEGEYVSEVLDATGWALWGNLQWDEIAPPDTSVRFQTRSGNVETVDETWSSWSAPAAKAEGSLIASPSTRFLQFRILLSTGNGKVTPEVHSVRIPYLIKNRRPEILSVKFTDSRTGTKADEKKDKTYKFDLKNFELSLAWEAKDPDNDDMEYSVLARTRGGKEWILLADLLKEKTLRFDTRVLPDSVYYFKILASDLPSNTRMNCLTNEMVSKPYIIDNTPPQISMKGSAGDNNRVRVEGTVKDGLSPVSRIQYSADGGDWVNLFPSDMIFDSTSESFRFEAVSKKGIVIVSAEDASGNIVTRRLSLK